MENTWYDTWSENCVLAFTKVNRLFVLSFENEEDRTSFSKYYVPKVEIKDFNVLIDRKNFLIYQWKRKKHKKKL